MTVAAARPASTVVLMRAGSDGPEVFLVRRQDTVAFMGGAHVFPGGRVDRDDYLPDAAVACDGVPGAVARMPDVPAADAIAFHAAAIRELFEEAGVLLARTRAGAMVTIEGASADRFERGRHELQHKQLTMPRLIAREQIRLAFDALALIAHWVTPEIEAKRFDTRFFLALAPDRQQAAHDARETSAGVWLRPSDALGRSRSGGLALPPPTWTTLRLLSRFVSVEEAWRWAQSCDVPRVQPGFVVRDDGSRLVLLPGDPLCPPIEGFSADDTRFVLKDGRWTAVDRD